MRIIVFGLTKNFDSMIKNVPSEDIIALSDNNKELWGNVRNGKTIIPPNEIVKTQYDYILIFSDYWKEIKPQLEGMGVSGDRIILYPNLGRLYTDDRIILFPGKNMSKNSESNTDNISYTKKKDRITFSIVATITQNKGQLEFLEALKLVEEKVLQRIRVILIGFNYKDDYYEKVKKTSNELGCVEIYGQIPNEEVRKFYKNDIVDVVVCPSVTETLSLSSVEGLMYGRCVIVSSGTGIAGFIKNEESGFVYESGNIYQLSKIIKRLCDNTDLISIIGSRGRKLYESSFSLNALSNEINEKILKTINLTSHKEFIGWNELSQKVIYGKYIGKDEGLNDRPMQKDDFEIVDKIESNTPAKRVLFFSHEMNSSGASLALLNLTKVLIKKDYTVDVLTYRPGPLINAFLDSGANVIYYPDAYNYKEYAAKLVNQYCFCVVNTVVLWEIVTFLCDEEIPVIWWLHDPEIFYNRVDVDKLKKIKFKNIYVAAVSQVAKQAYQNKIKNEDTIMLTPGIV